MKRIWKISLICVLIAFSALALSKGDPNNDGKVNVIDARICWQYALGLISLAEDQKKACDVAPPCGTIDFNDVTLIAEVSIGLKHASDFNCLNPGIDIEKTPDTQQVVSGGTATFTITVKNSGDVDLTDATVSDAQAPDCARTIGDLHVGDPPYTYPCSLANVTTDFTNSATVTGTSPVGADVSDTDTASVDVNARPTATITSPTDGSSFTQGDTITFAGSATDPEDGALTGASLVWESSINGQIGTGESFTRSDLSVGTHTITLTATDSQGATGTDSVTITVTAPLPNQPPTAVITAPADGSSFAQGDTITFAGSGSDPEDGPLTGASLVWTSSIDGQIGTGESFTRNDLSVWTHTITLTATDLQGATGTDSVAIIVEAPEAKTWYVDDDLQDCPDAYFTRIQDAVEAASNGDIIVVCAGTYTENVSVTKRLAIKSRSGADSVLVQAADPKSSVFRIHSDYVTISEFTAQGATDEAGIYLVVADYCNILGNIAINNRWGIRLGGSNNNIIRGNNILNNEKIGEVSAGIYLYNSTHNTIESNIGLGNRTGIILDYLSHSNDIIYNTFDSNRYTGIYLGAAANFNVVKGNSANLNGDNGIELWGSKDNIIERNDASQNDHAGIHLYSSDLYSSSGNIIKNNQVISNTWFGIYLSASGNRIYLNNFINNGRVDPHKGGRNVYYQSGNIWNSEEMLTYIYHGDAYTNYLGNHFDDYTGSDADGDGVGDTPYMVGLNEIPYPLMEPFENYTILE